jgi:hypothetical protein
MAKKFLKTDDAEEFLKLHIIKGDTGDGIPNFLSEDDAIVAGVRQKSVTEKKLNIWLKEEPQVFCDSDMMRRYKRNEALIDLSKVPAEYQENILNTYNSTPKKGREKLLTYFINNRMKLLIEHLQEF